MLRRLAALVALLAAATVARATTLVALDTPALFARSQLVAVADVLSLDVRRSGGLLTTVATLEIERPVKGANIGDRVTVLVPGGALGEWGQYVEGAPELRVGDSAVVFLTPTIGGYRFTGMEQGHLKIVPDLAAKGGFSVVRSFHARLVAAKPGAPVVRPPAREPLASFLAGLDRLPGAGK